MKNKIVYGVLGLSIAAFGTIGTYVLFTDNEDKVAVAAIETKESSPEIVEHPVSADDLAKSVKEIGEIKDEDTLNSIMEHMSLQKVNIGDEQFTPKGIDPNSINRIQMTKENITYLKQSLGSIDISRNTSTDGYDYESILNKWLEGNFDNITKEFEFLLGLYNNGVYTGDEVTKKSEAEEKEYISHFFN
ncbi:DUF6241 domain-containing protein [Domibacillus sp. A3M-37]|uniref:DUF6241 domain-containing protein n=1 Tax=Domibacillus sp. A3M-37 TaxID=2962037 RepID=UPI0020B67B5A|nr:DUF6241 domain-containing protein [Domibacillus sp. A3M-37]MCP3765081.1 DUF6241 domain-containing protein [Domibacillus sp. A3M-37]